MNTNDSPRPTPRQCADDQTIPLPPYPFRRASGSRDPLLLCETCTRIPIDSIPVDWRYAPYHTFFTHHHNFISLLESVWSGCELCAVFLDGYLDKWCKSENVDREAARLSNLRLDSSSTFAFIITPNYLPGNSLQQRNKFVGICFERQNRGMTVGYFISQPDLENCKPADITFVHREVPPYPDFEIAKDWIRQCRDAHSRCWSDQLDPPLLPTRVIDVGPDDGAQEPRLLVVPDGMRGRYVSLSHCWGDTKPLTTTTSNLHSHQELIPFGLLPLTFQHAVLATRHVGIRYLWIDSLCIVQDSEDDWQAECGKMTEVYVRSTVTVAAAAAFDSNAGFLHRGGPQHATHVWQHNDQPRSSRNRFLIRRADSNPEERAHDTEMSSPLASRAWIFQEMFLSTRVLYFGSRKMYWQCETAAQFENLLFPTLGDYGKEGKGVGSAPPPPMERTPTHRFPGDDIRYQPFYLSNKWYQIVTEYSKRQLTHKSDKLPAISGVARWLWSADAENYLAGLIRGDLRRGLGWICSPSGGKVLATPTPPRRPSWSWIATDGPVDFFHEVASDVRLSAFQSWRDPSGPEFLSATTVKLGPDPFGAVAGGILRLRAHWKMASVDVAPSSNQTPDRTVAPLRLCDPENTDESIAFFPDDPSLWAKGDMARCVLLASGVCWYAMVVVEDALASTAPPEDQNANIGGDSSETVSEDSAKKIARVRRVGVAGGYTKMGSQGPEWWSGAVRAELEIV